MSAFEDRLEAMLAEERERIELAVALVQRAADAWVSAFREQIEKMLKDPKATHAFLPTPVPPEYIPTILPTPEAPSALSSEAQEAIQGMLGRSKMDESAINSNMNGWK